jgi:septum formation topological specificity factor MinE
MNRWIKLFNQSFASNNQSSKVARDRLSEMLQNQRNIEFFSNINMNELRNELTIVLRKYINITQNEPAQFLGITEYFFNNQNIPIVFEGLFFIF